MKDAKVSRDACPVCFLDRFVEGLFVPFGEFGGIHINLSLHCKVFELRRLHGSDDGFLVLGVWRLCRVDSYWWLLAGAVARE